METSELDPIWKALADPTRRAMLDLLVDRPRMTGELAAAFPRLSRFAVMKHLAVLEEAGLVLVRRRGRERWNHLNAVPIRALAERWIGRYEAIWADSLLRVKEIVEEPRATNGEETTMPYAIDAGPIPVRSMLIEEEVEIAAPPSRVFAALTADVGRWWNHTFGHGAVRLDPRVGGHFQESWGDGEGAIYATVGYVKRDEMLRMTGPMGMLGAVVNVMTFRLEPSALGTTLKLSHHGFGELDENTEAGYTGGWQELLGGRLKRLVETGDPEPR